MSLRRQTRLRKEYLYRKSLEGKERQNYERKERIKAALRAGKALPTELRNEEAQLRAEIEADEHVIGGQQTSDERIDLTVHCNGRRRPNIQ